MYGTNAVESKAIPVLDKRIFQQYNLLHHGPVAQLGAHYIRIVGVGSSNLLGSTNKQSHPSGGFVYWYAGDSKILMELSGGQFPARDPRAAPYFYESPRVLYSLCHPLGGFVYWYAGDSKNLMELSGGQFPARPPSRSIYSSSLFHKSVI